MKALRTIGIAAAAWLSVLAAACSEKPEDALEACKFEARKAYPAADLSAPMGVPDQVRAFVASCMGTKGFVRNGGAAGCVLTDVEMQPACYARR